MENRINMNFDLLMNNSLLDSLKPKALRRAKLLFILAGFGIGSLVSILTILIENSTFQIPFFSTITNYHHLVAPIILGVTGALLGIIYERWVKQEKLTYRALYESQQTLRLITDNLPSLISYIDSDLCYQFANKTHADWLRIPVEEIKGKHIKDILGRRGFDKLYPFIKKAFEGETVNFENIGFIRRRHRAFFNSVIIPHFERGRSVKGVFVLVTDITQLKKREFKIEKQRKELQEMNTTKDKLFSVIGHDLKNPFNSILGFSELLSREIISIDQEEARDIAVRLNEKSKQAYDLLSNILDWARTQLNRIESSPENIHLNELTDEMFEQLQDISAAKKVMLRSDISDDIQVFADRNMLHSVLRNLLTNSIKFTHPGGQVLVAAGPSNNFIKISVKDDGVGMDDDQLSHLFSLESEHTTEGTNSEKGTGLGLLICKEFIEANGGKIKVKSAKGEGTTIVFTLPVPQEEDSA